MLEKFVVGRGSTEQCGATVDALGPRYLDAAGQRVATVITLPVSHILATRCPAGQSTSTRVPDLIEARVP